MITLTCTTCPATAHGPTVESAARAADLPWHDLPDGDRGRLCPACRQGCDCRHCEVERRAS